VIANLQRCLRCVNARCRCSGCWHLRDYLREAGLNNRPTLVVWRFGYELAKPLSGGDTPWLTACGRGQRRARWLAGSAGGKVHSSRLGSERAAKPTCHVRRRRSFCLDSAPDARPVGITVQASRSRVFGWRGVAWLSF